MISGISVAPYAKKVSTPLHAYSASGIGFGQIRTRKLRNSARSCRNKSLLTRFLSPHLEGLFTSDRCYPFPVTLGDFYTNALKGCSASQAAHFRGCETGFAERKGIRQKSECLFTVVFYGLLMFCCKTARFCATGRDSRSAAAPRIRIALQRSESTRKNSSFNYESPALTAEL
jgi:hypothetical protein